MFWKRINVIRFVMVIFFGTVAVLIASLTIGKDIYENNAMSMFSFAILNFSGYLFFLFMPVELAFIFYSHSGYHPWILFGVAVSTALAAQSIDYLIGYFFSKEIIHRLIGRRRYLKAEVEIRKYGRLALFVFNLLPLSSPVIALAAGMLKYRIKDALMYSSIGLVIKYLLLLFIF